MKSFARHPVFVGFTVLLSVLLKTWAFAALEYELRQGLTLNWYFENADPAWPSTVEAGYFHDFNSDGLPDYLIHQSNSTNQDRIFCLNTSNADAPKTFADHTALRVIDWTPGTFIPDDIYLKKKTHEKRTPDIILFGTDSQDPESLTKFIFWKLDETENTFPNEDAWSIDVAGQYNPELLWSEYDFNDDDYPDFFYLLHPAESNGQFRRPLFRRNDRQSNMGTKHQ